MIHASHPDVIARLKRAHGHLAAVIDMIESGRGCVEIAQQLHAVETAIANAKKLLIHDHIEHCLGDHLDADETAPSKVLAEFKQLAKYL
jgi:hypothetical protein NreA